MPSRRRRIVERTVAACAVFIVYAPPASTLPHELQFQMPTFVRFTVSLPQNMQVNLECCEISIFFTCFLSEEPYRTPYLPVIPAFLVRLDTMVTAGEGGAAQRVSFVQRPVAHPTVSAEESARALALGLWPPAMAWQTRGAFSCSTAGARGDWRAERETHADKHKPLARHTARSLWPERQRCGAARCTGGS